MPSVTDYLLQLQSLTKTNLGILKALNESFHTKQGRLVVDIDGESFAIPSFISLENKINALQENFENLVNAPSTGEAYFNFDGNSRAIELRGYTHTPHRIVLSNVERFGKENNDIFKDFLTPKPYINFKLSTLPNDITSVVVKKIIPISDQLKTRLKEMITESSSQINYSDIYKIISIYDEDVDYIEYDRVMKLPIRKNIGTGTYVIEKILKDEIDVDLDNYITLKFRTDLDGYKKNLTYSLFDETISKNLSVGDELVTWDGSAKMVITEVRNGSNTLVVKLMHGEYLNLVESGDDEKISDFSKLRFFSPANFDDDKYINIPLEEDELLFVAIAALNDRMNIQGPWGSGVLINTNKLYDENGISFKKYYDENVRNVGDVLFEITSAMSNTLTKYSPDQFKTFTTTIPVIDQNHILVTQINNHLNNSDTVKNIRSLYSQKKTDQIALSEIQIKIDDINSKLANISFEDTNSLRPIYTSQLTEYNAKKNELITSITKTIDAISLAVNNSEVPIENAKYRIRGFFDIMNYAKSLGIDHSHICGIQVQYRYKNVNQEQGNALSIGDKNDGSNLFIFSDWNIMDGFQNQRVAEWDGTYKFNPTEYNGNVNEPSFNQIDIPISQGETVDIRLKVIYDFGKPFVEVTSAWSEIYNVKFPDEFLKDIQLLDIITENNSDIETNRFSNIIREKGIPEHIDDRLVDQNIIYYHRPESIASGFHTAERRIIPLKDKLVSMDTDIQNMKDEMMGSSADALTVSIVNGDMVNILHPFQDNHVILEAYNEIKTGGNTNGVYMYNDGVVSTLLNVVLTNNSEHTVKLFSLFPGSRDLAINNLSRTKFDINDYCKESDKGVWVYVQDEKTYYLQSANQILTFRINNPYDGEQYYGDGLLSLNKPETPGSNSMTMYPLLNTRYAMCIDSNVVSSYITIAPKSELIIPIMVQYRAENEEIIRHMSFDIRTSLYRDPVNYTFKVIAKDELTTQDKLTSSIRKNYGATTANGQVWTKYNPSEIR